MTPLHPRYSSYKRRKTQTLYRTRSFLIDQRYHRVIPDVYTDPMSQVYIFPGSCHGPTAANGQSKSLNNNVLLGCGNSLHTPLPVLATSIKPRPQTPLPLPVRPSVRGGPLTVLPRPYYTRLWRPCQPVPWINRERESRA